MSLILFDWIVELMFFLSISQDLCPILTSTITINPTTIILYFKYKNPYISRNYQINL